MVAIPFLDYPADVQFRKIKEKLSEAIRFIDDATHGVNYHDYHGAIVCVAAAYNMLDMTRIHWPTKPRHEDVLAYLADETLPAQSVIVND